MPVPEPCAVTIRNGRAWSSGASTPKICRILARMEDIGFRSIEAAAIKRLGLQDVGTRDPDGEEHGRDEKEKRPGVSNQRKLRKAVAMEVVVAEALTRLDHQEKVQSFWKVSDPSDEPIYFAPPYTPDLLVPTTAAAPSFQIICEVSSGRHMTRQYLRTQLDSALSHCEAAHEARDDVEITYGLLVNSGQIATNASLQRAYRKFIADNESVLGDPHGGIRIVALRTLDFSVILQRLYDHDQLEFPKALLFRALDEIHLRLRQATVPKDEEWMLEVFRDVVTAEPDLLDQGATSS